MPEESKRKTGDTDQVLPEPNPDRGPGKRDDRTEMAARLEEAMTKAGVDRDDLTGDEKT